MDGTSSLSEFVPDFSVRMDCEPDAAFAAPPPTDAEGSAQPIRPSLIIDVRERALIDALRAPADAAGVSFDVRQLDVADAEVRGVDGELLLLVERKTLPDLAGSLRDGRYHEQKRRLASLAAETGAAVAYVIEGGAFSFDARMRPVSTLAPSRLQALVASLLVRHRTPAAFTRDVSDTAAFLLLAARLLREAPPKRNGNLSGYAAAACRQAAACAPKKRDNVDPRQCFLQQLCQVPGVSAGIAANVAERYGSLGELVRTLSALPGDPERRKALREVPLVGPKLSEHLCRFLLL